MPFITGITGVFAIHKILPDLPVIVLTAFGSPDVKAECFRQGAKAFLEKPLDTPHVLEGIKGIFASPDAGLDLGEGKVPVDKIKKPARE